MKTMDISPTFAASLGLLLTAAVTFLAGMGTRNWVKAGDDLTVGLWDYCVNSGDSGDWICFDNYTEFTMATQAFCILTVVGFACAFLLYLVYLILPSLNKSRVLTVAICVVAFSIVSLQIMAMVVFGVNVTDYQREISRLRSPLPVGDLDLSWSFGLAILSTLLSTAAGICVSLELRNITVPEFVEQ